jgi:predicted RNA-binding Zn ribbon-like protein
VLSVRGDTLAVRENFMSGRHDPRTFERSEFGGRGGHGKNREHGATTGETRGDHAKDHPREFVTCQVGYAKSEEDRSVKRADTREGFRFRAGHVSLDLPATLAARLKSEPRELLARPSDLARWLHAAEVTAAAPEVTADDLETAKTLREAIYRLALARIEGEEPPRHARRKLNRLAAESPALPQLGKHYEQRLSGTTRELLVSIAREAIGLLGGDLAERIRQCEAETCALLFVDTSRSGDRRWCSMSGCGNKAKVAAFRKRQRRGRA